MTQTYDYLGNSNGSTPLSKENLRAFDPDGGASSNGGGAFGNNENPYEAVPMFKSKSTNSSAFSASKNGGGQSGTAGMPLSSTTRFV